MNRMVVTGASGLLGSEVVSAARERGYEVVPLARGDLDVTDEDRVRGVLREEASARGTGASPGASLDVVHCAAYTAVDAAEADAERAALVNREGTRLVARAAAEAGARFVYVSSDYVFDGEGRVPYLPDAPTRPLSVYGGTKLEGEREALLSQPGALVVRTSWLYGSHGRNFVTSMLDLGRTRQAAGATEPLRVVNDQRGRPSWARNVAAGLLDLLERRVRGVWHVADGGDASWLELARELFRVTGVDVAVEPVTTEAWGAPAPRPAYSVLDLSATEALLGRPATPWREALRKFLTERGETHAG